MSQALTRVPEQGALPTISVISRVGVLTCSLISTGLSRLVLLPVDMRPLIMAKMLSGVL